ncbi:GntR family transcriptional regulator [Pseudonocardiaceae bacterium YIM PH 21723]|nr:GntR family transcriptional regulator [Pseudonocardiaceae bacterium YIM PH 21723]
MPTIDRSDGRPYYRQIADDLRRRIIQGQYGPGDQLPSERVLTEDYETSRLTVRQAIGLLRTEGLLLAEHGRGLFVRAAVPVQRLARTRLDRAQRQAGAGAFQTDAQRAGFQPSVDVDVYSATADARIAELLQVSTGSRLIVRERLMMADKVPVQLSTSWLPAELAAGTRIELRDTGPGGIYARLEEKGHLLARFTESVRARMPSQDEASALRLAVGTPVLAVTRTAFDQHGRPVETNDMVLAADRYELTYEFSAD